MVFLTSNKILTIKGITLIEVPYWWDRKYESLEATIYKQRPELLKDRKITEQPIPSDPPNKIKPDS